MNHSEANSSHTQTSSKKTKQWQFWIDRGGTFTDIIALDTENQLHTHKLLSENPEQYADAAIAGIRYFLDIAADSPIPSGKIHSVKMGTTVATNALLERKGEAVALVTNRGFKEALQIGYQNRPDIFALEVRTPKPLYKTSIEIDGRLDAAGKAIAPLNEAATKTALKKLKKEGFESIAIVLLHSYLNSLHEQQVRQWAQEIGFLQISISSETSSLIKYISRGRTTVVDAYLSPILQRYVTQVSNALPGVNLQFMQSHGGLTDAQQFQGKDAILSGPAGGIVAAVKTAQHAGFEKIIGFDMGGTSTDVSHFSGQFERSFETEVAGVQMRVPMLDIHTVAAGGGSILSTLENELLVGPESSGANPGPAAYRRGGPLSITDCNLLLGRIQPDFFPHVFGPKANQPLDKKAVTKSFTKLVSKLHKSAEEIAEGAINIAVENMANAVQKISTQRGYDLKDYTLVSFGGAGGQHACSVARKLDIKQVLLHPYSGVLSAYGMGLAQKRVIETQSFAIPLTQLFESNMVGAIEALRHQASSKLIAQNETAELFDTTLHLQYKGSDTLLDVQLQQYMNVAGIEAEFTALHQQQFGFVQDGLPILINSISVEAVGASHEVSQTPNTNDDEAPLIAKTHVSSYYQGTWINTPVYERNQLQPHHHITGPALILESTGTLYIEPQWQIKLLGDGQLLLQQVSKNMHSAQHPTEQRNHKSHNTLPPQEHIYNADPVELALFNNRFMAIAEQMGATLAKTAHSVNIKERLDFSCALFDKQGQLIANAPHVPVHLGSMGESVKTVIQRQQNGQIPAFKDGDAYVLNNPYAGGTHLPDITLISPILFAGNVEFFVASRGHHADIGGLTPGSMPANSQHIEEEGVLLDCLAAVRNGILLTQELSKAFTEVKYPVRNLQQNLNDLQAQIAANQSGIQALAKLVEQNGLAKVKAYMKHVLNHAEQAVKNLIPKLKTGEFCYQTDQHVSIKVRVTPDIKKQTLMVDFCGSSEQQENNFNAPFSITRAATLYVMRTLVNQPIPLNDGFLRPVHIKVDENSVLNPSYPAAVVAGNVETSQVITDVLYGALQTQAASQGTMNNLTFGDQTWQYYETICGGTGAGPGYHGEDAVHSHMTNSRLTDPEILESRYPVRLDYFGLHHNSGGLGEFNGGNGCERHFTFLKPLMVSMLTNHRFIAPYALQGAKPAKVGEQFITNQSAKTHNLPISKLNSTFSQLIKEGQTLVIKTPGGGGYGKKKT